MSLFTWFLSADALWFMRDVARIRRQKIDLSNDKIWQMLTSLRFDNVDICPRPHSCETGQCNQAAATIKSSHLETIWSYWLWWFDSCQVILAGFYSLSRSTIAWINDRPLFWHLFCSLTNCLGGFHQVFFSLDGTHDTAQEKALNVLD